MSTWEILYCAAHILSKINGLYGIKIIHESVSSEMLKF